jgi:hypothetical protein
MSTRLHTLQGQRIPEYDAAILSCSVTLQQIVEVRYKLHAGSHVHERDSLILYEELLWLAYQRARGTIIEYYFGMERRAAAILIKPHDRRYMDLDLYYPIDELRHLTPQFETTIWTCISQFQSIAQLDFSFQGQDAVFLELYLIVIYLFVVVEAQQALQRVESRQVLQREAQQAREREAQQALQRKRYRDVLGRATRLLKWSRSSTRRIPAQESLHALSAPVPDAPNASVPDRVNTKAIEDLVGERIKEALGQADKHLGKLADKINEFANREVQAIYLRAMFPGALSVIILAAIYTGCIFWLSRRHDPHWTSATQMSWYLVAIAVTSGALGAAVSVMLRIANQPLSIDYHASRRLIQLAGGTRPIVGAVFGFVFYLLISAGLLQVIAAPRGIGNSAHLVAAICFAAGFSERRAQDLIVRALPTGTGTEVGTDRSPARRPEEGIAS